MFKKIGIVLGLVLLFSFTACAYQNKDFISASTTRYSDSSMLYFKSSDDDLDAFLNDYMNRHLRYDENSIGYFTIGNACLFDKEWETKSLVFFDTTSNNVSDDRYEMLSSWLNNLPVDKFGYVWQNMDTPPLTAEMPSSTFHQGWPWPDYNLSRGRTTGWEFASKNNSEGWSVLADGKTVSPVVSNGLMSVDVLNADSVEFISPENFTINTSAAPYLYIDMRAVQSDILSSDGAIENVEIWWQCEGDSEFSTAKMADYKSWCSITDTIPSNWSQVMYYPLFAHTEWGSDNVVKKLKIVVKTSETENFSGNIGMNFIRTSMDSRTPFNSAWYICSVAEYFKYTGDEQLLAENLPRLRAAMQFNLTYLEGEKGLINNSMLVGHDGGIITDVGQSLGFGWADLLAYPQYDLLSNVYFYKSLTRMKYLEECAAALGITAEMPTVYARNNVDQVTYSETPQSLQELADTVKANLQKPVDTSSKTGFYDTSKGRFIEGFDKYGNVVDYGYVQFNLELVNEGIATPEQEKQVMSWISGERIVQSDIDPDVEQNYASGKVGTARLEDGSFDLEGTYGIYDYEFAPRFSTVKNYQLYAFIHDGSTPFGQQVQDGGVSMHTSYYDIAARMRVYGEDNAFGRLKEINAWYNKVWDAAKESGVGTDIESDQFYHAYYDELGITLQGNGVWGGVGLDAEFLESAMLYVTVPDVFFGMGSSSVNTLDVSPNLPSSLTFWKMENLRFNDVMYDLTISENAVCVDRVLGNTDGLRLNVKLKKSSGKSTVYVNGKKTSDFIEKDGYVIVNVPFAGCTVEVK